MNIKWLCGMWLLFALSAGVAGAQPEVWGERFTTTLPSGDAWRVSEFSTMSLGRSQVFLLTPTPAPTPDLDGVRAMVVFAEDPAFSTTRLSPADAAQTYLERFFHRLTGLKVGGLAPLACQMRGASAQAGLKGFLLGGGEVQLCLVREVKGGFVSIVLMWRLGNRLSEPALEVFQRLSARTGLLSLD